MEKFRVVLAEIGPEGGLRHNSPLKHVVHLRRGHGRRPLRRRTKLATITSPPARLANSVLPLNHFYFYSYFYFYFYYFALGKNKTLRTKALKLNWSLRSSLLINVCPFSYKETTIYRRPRGCSIIPITPFPFLTNGFTRFSRV
jgi:hypothetical protein